MKWGLERFIEGGSGLFIDERTYSCDCAGEASLCLGRMVSLSGFDGQAVDDLDDQRSRNTLGQSCGLLVDVQGACEGGQCQLGMLQDC